jgi:hypothetical protein
MASTAVTASGTGALTSNVADFGELNLQVVCTVFTGAPTFTVTLQTSLDDGNSWSNVGAAIPVTAVGAVPLTTYGLSSASGGFGAKIRVIYTLTGGTTPHVTFSVAALAKG